MTEREPEAHLPSDITLTLAEAAQVLFALDLAVERTEADSPDRLVASAAQRLVTSKLWPELGQVLDEPDDGGE